MLTFYSKNQETFNISNYSVTSQTQSHLYHIRYQSHYHQLYSHHNTTIPKQFRI